MLRTNIHLPERTLAQLKTLQAKTGLPVAELVRRAIDAYILTQTQQGQL